MIGLLVREASDVHTYASAEANAPDAPGADLG